MRYVFTNGSATQKKLWQEPLGYLLNLPADAIPLTVTVTFQPSVEGQTAFASTTYTYDSPTATTAVRSDAPGFGDLDAGLIQEARQDGLTYNSVMHFHETAIHELGHAVFAAVPHQFRVKIAQMFGAKSDDIEELSAPAQWQNRVVEAIAETFKEAFLPARFRVFSSRATKKISYAEFPAFRRLVREGLAQVPEEAGLKVEIIRPHSNKDFPAMPIMRQIDYRLETKRLWREDAFCVGDDVLELFGATQPVEAELSEYDADFFYGADVPKATREEMVSRIKTMAKRGEDLEVSMVIRPSTFDSFAEEFSPDSEGNPVENPWKNFFWSRAAAAGYRQPIFTENREEVEFLEHYLPPAPMLDYYMDSIVKGGLGRGALFDAFTEPYFAIQGEPGPGWYPVEAVRNIEEEEGKFDSGWLFGPLKDRREAEKWAVSHDGTTFHRVMRIRVRGVWELLDGSLAVTEPRELTWEGDVVWRLSHEDREGDEINAQSVYNFGSGALNGVVTLEYPEFTDVAWTGKDALVWPVPAGAKTFRGVVVALRKILQRNGGGLADPYLRASSPVIDGYSFKVGGHPGGKPIIVPVGSVLGTDALSGRQPKNLPVSGVSG